jgi:RNA polymerase sigma-70 factor (ECF subfamily)
MRRKDRNRMATIPPSGSGNLTSSPGVCPEEWVDQHGDALFRYALLRVRNRSMAEDLVQESFLAALKSQPRFRGDSEVRTWLIGILRHKIIDHLRAADRRTTSEPSDGGDSLIDSWFAPDGRWVTPPAQLDIDPARLLERKEFWEVFQRCLEAVPGRAGEAFALRMLSDVTADTVCKELSITSTNLWVLLHRARARLRACLEVNWFGRPPEEST